jgi:hypothetical protein
METFQTWIRLHPESTDDTMVTSVQARMHDPLWLLGRQWQFDDLRHDAGATPIDVRVEGVVSPLTRLRAGSAEPTAAGSASIATTRVPLETLVECEPVPETQLDNLRLRTEAGMHLLRMLRAAGIEQNRIAFWVNQSPFAGPGPDADEDTRNWLALVSGKVPDGADLPRAIRQQLTPPAGTPPLTPAEATVVRAWLAWSAARFDRPGGASTWDPEHMEYAFATSGMRSNGEAVLVAPEYLEGRLEWYDFDEGNGTLGTTGTATPQRAFRIPAPLDFAGMPNPRFWTFEDPSVRFDALEVLANPDVAPSPATLMVLDFTLSYSDDWFLIPLKLDAWTIFDAVTVAITDVFGDVTVAQPPDGRWNLFRLESSTAPSNLSRLFLNASPAESLDGPPLEEVHFLRDEVANVAWAVERVTPHPLGCGRDTPETASTPNVPTPPGLTWTMTPPPPPGNWFPLLPLVVGRLALGTLWSARNQKPAGRVLADLRAPRRLHQEEVPPEGAQVARRWQSARALDGSLHFWIGRSKTPRKTDIAPAVRFDVVDWS